METLVFCFKTKETNVFHHQNSLTWNTNRLTKAENKDRPAVVGGAAKRKKEKMEHCLHSFDESRSTQDRTKSKSGLNSVFEHFCFKTKE